MYNIYKKEIQGHIKENKQKQIKETPPKKTKNKIQIKNKENQKTIKKNNMQKQMTKKYTSSPAYVLHAALLHGQSLSPSRDALC